MKTFSWIYYYLKFIQSKGLYFCLNFYMKFQIKFTLLAFFIATQRPTFHFKFISRSDHKHPQRPKPTHSINCAHPCSPKLCKLHQLLVGFWQTLPLASLVPIRDHSWKNNFTQNSLKIHEHEWVWSWTWVWASNEQYWKLIFFHSKIWFFASINLLKWSYLNGFYNWYELFIWCSWKQNKVLAFDMNLS